MPRRLVHACFQVTEHVWQPMHLSRFMTMAIWAIGRISTRPPGGRGLGGGSCPWRSGPWDASVLALLVGAADVRRLVTLVARGAQVVEGPAQLGVAADEMGRFEDEPGERVVDAAAPAGGHRDGD